jgi:hypothetical protein
MDLTKRARKALGTLDVMELSSHEVVLDTAGRNKPITQSSVDKSPSKTLNDQIDKVCGSICNAFNHQLSSKKRVSTISRETSRMLLKTERSTSSNSYSLRYLPVEVTLIPPVPLSLDSSSNPKPLVIRSEEVPTQVFSISSDSEPETVSGRLGRLKKRVSDHTSEAARAARIFSRADQAESYSLVRSSSLRDLDPYDMYLSATIQSYSFDNHNDGKSRGVKKYGKIPCFYFNQSECMLRSCDCEYSHSCAICGSSLHGWSSCGSRFICIDYSTRNGYENKCRKLHCCLLCHERHPMQSSSCELYRERVCEGDPPLLYCWHWNATGRCGIHDCERKHSCLFCDSPLHGSYDCLHALMTLITTKFGKYCLPLGTRFNPEQVEVLIIIT